MIHTHCVRNINSIILFWTSEPNLVIKFLEFQSHNLFTYNSWRSQNANLHQNPSNLRRLILMLNSVLETMLVTMLNQLLFCTSFCWCLRSLKILLVSLRSGLDPRHGIFFLYTFFIYFINFPSAVEMSSSIQNFSIIIFFVREIQCFLF